MERKHPQDEKKVTPAALTAFRRMRKLECQCTCPPIDWAGKYWEREQCAACAAWWDAHWTLHQELKCLPSQWPCIEEPGAVSPYPSGSHAAEEWKPDLEAQSLYGMLLSRSRKGKPAA
jgi:hypothetical protein